MRKISLLLFIAISLLPSQASASEIDVNIKSPQQTSAPINARYEILQSTLAAKFTFKLDRFTGRIWELVQTKNNEYTWQETEVYNRPATQSTPKPRFQLFTSGIAARYTFLLDGETGKTWVLVTGQIKDSDGTSNKYRAWQLFAK